MAPWVRERQQQQQQQPQMPVGPTFVHCCRYYSGTQVHCCCCRRKQQQQQMQVNTDVFDGPEWICCKAEAKKQFAINSNQQTMDTLQEKLMPQQQDQQMGLLIAYRKYRVGLPESSV